MEIRALTTSFFATCRLLTVRVTCRTIDKKGVPVATRQAFHYVGRTWPDLAGRPADWHVVGLTAEPGWGELPASRDKVAA